MARSSAFSGKESEGRKDLGVDHYMAKPSAQLPWSNCRLRLASEEPEEDDGIVARLYYVPGASHPAIRQPLTGLVARSLSLGALAVQHLVNKRGPDGLVGCIPGESKHSAALLELSTACFQRGEVLVCSIPAADVVLVPRTPTAAARDGLYFLAYAIVVSAVALCESLRAAQLAAVVLDCDATLVDASAVTLAQKDWDALDWRFCEVTTGSGRRVEAQHARLQGWAPLAEETHLIHWKAGRVSCTFKVCVRHGWGTLREFLLREASRFLVFICSKGKREYVELLLHILDPGHALVPKHAWAPGGRVNSTFPDTLARAAHKTALTALGCAPVTSPRVAVPTQLAAPLICVDDSPDAYSPPYFTSVLYVPEYRPSDLLAADCGNVLGQVAERLGRFWEAAAGPAGSGAWQAAQSFAVALLGAMQRVPMESPDALRYLQRRSAAQGEALWQQITVASVFGPEAVIQDLPGLAAPQQQAPRAVLTRGEDSSSYMELATPDGSPAAGLSPLDRLSSDGSLDARLAEEAELNNAEGGSAGQGLIKMAVPPIG